MDEIVFSPPQMSEYFNDSPIQSPDDDRYGITPFAKSLAKSILNIKDPVGTTIALNGPWGSGKSSAVNLVRHELKQANDENLVVSDFFCWWYRGEEALVLAFFQHLNAVLRNSLKDKVGNLVTHLGRNLIQAGPVIGSAVTLATLGPTAIPATATAQGAAAANATKFVEKLFPEETLEKTFKKLTEILEKEKRRFLIIIDDIDRLSPDEALAIFRLVKSVGRLPNVMYLLVFDRALADKAVAERYPSEGSHFLEKIIQAEFDLPMPIQADLNEAMLNAIERVCGELDESEITTIMNMFFDFVVPYITTPRHVIRFENVISVTWPAIAGEVYLADFILLEILRIYEPILFGLIRINKDKFCDQHQRNEADVDQFLAEVDETDHKIFKKILKYLFPRFGFFRYNSDSSNICDGQRRVCISHHFDTYFRFSLSEEVLSSQEINEFINRADDHHFVKSKMIEASKKIRKNGSSMIPVYLDTLNINASRVESQKIQLFLSILFEIHDEIDLEIDDNGANGNTTLRFHWLIHRLTRNQFSIEDRTKIYLTALKNASLGWLVEFTISAIERYEKDDEKNLLYGEHLVTKVAISELVEQALRRIRSAAQDGSLLHHNDLLNILYRWHDFLGNSSEVKAWTEQQFDDQNAVVIFAKKFIRKRKGSSLGLYKSLPDRVYPYEVKVDIDNDIGILDAQIFKAKLESILDSETLDEYSRETVKMFLNTWEKQQDS